MDQRDNSDKIEGYSRSNNANKPFILTDTELETSDDHSQDLFNDDDSTAQDSPSINFDLSEKGIVKVIDTPRTADLLASLMGTPKFGKDNSYEDRPTVPTVPSSLVPFITTVNESWTSDLETPQAKTADQAKLRDGNPNGQFSASCEIVERKGCGSTRANAAIPHATTPSGCFVAGTESEGFCISPILNTMIKRRRPKRRILKSLNDPSVSIDTSTDFAKVCHISADDYAAKEMEKLESGIEESCETSRRNSPGPINDTTFVIDVDSSLHNSNIRLSQDETNNGAMDYSTEVESVKNDTQDSILTENDEEKCSINERMQGCEDFEENDANETMKNEEEGMRMDSLNAEISADKTNEQSLVERVREIRELEEKREEYSADREFADIPIDVFTRDAKALESADFLPRVAPGDRKTAKKQWGLISFTEMCLLEQENSENDDFHEKETNVEATTVESVAPTFEADEEMVDIFASSFNDKEAEPAIEFDEFSPWFYQSQVLNDADLGGTKTASKTIEGDKNHGAKVEAKVCTNLATSRYSTGFSTAGGMPIKIDEDKLKAAAKLYDEISLQDEKRDVLSSKMLLENRRGEQINYQDSSTSVGFSTAAGKPINIDEDKLKAAAKLYDEISLQDGKPKMLPEIRRNQPSDVKDTETKILKDAPALVGFATASGKSIKINEAKLKAAAKLYEEILSADNFQQPVDSLRANVPRGVKRTYECQDTDSGANSSFGFTTASGKPLIVGERAMKKAKMMYLSEDIPESWLPNGSTKRLTSPKDSEKMNNGDVCKSPEISNEFAKGTDLISDIQRSKQLTCTENVCKVIAEVSVNGGNKIPSGFSTAGGRKIKISEQALSKAKTMFSEEDERHESGTANEGPIRISAAAPLKGKRIFPAEQENTPPHHNLLKRSSSAMENSGVNHFLNSKSPKKFSSEDSTPVLTKKIRFNTDSLARKLFSEKGGDTDEETEHQDNISENNDRASRTPLGSSTNYARNLLSPEHRRDSTIGMYAKSETFQINNDRPMSPKLKPQKTWPTNLDIGAIQFDGTSSGNRNVKIPQMQKEGRMSTVCDEITASTEALLADEESSLDGKRWATAITCSPATKQDRDISAKAITQGAGCDDCVNEAPTSPIIGTRFRSRKKSKLNKKNVSHKNGIIVKRLKDNGGNNTNEESDERLVTQDSQQSSSVATPSSDSSKGSHRNMSPVIEAALVSKLEKLVDDRSENGIQPTTTEKEDAERMNIFLENRIAATLEQEKKIRTKKKSKPKPIPGSLWLCKTENKGSRVAWRRATNGVAPTPKTPCELLNLGARLDVMEINAATALRYKFKCTDFYSKDKIHSSVDGLEMSDGARLIVDENCYAGVAEFEQAFLASPGVDPNLLHEKWVENHYRWIVWKLASMDRMKFGDLSLPRMLTPRNVMEQLKYRYDREIDKSQRPALRRIIEKDDPASRRIVLCVATITKLENIQTLEKSPRITPTSCWNLELTDGWYGVAATVDPVMGNLIASGKVREGTKLVTSRAELLNCEQGCFPLEMLSDVSLKIHTNSTRRSRWDAKLGFCRYASPMPMPVSAVLPYGGLIGKLVTTIARIYPVQYFEKTWSGQSVFRNNKCEDKAIMMYEKERQAQIDTIYAKTRAKFEARSRKNSKNDDDSNSYPNSVADKKVQRSLGYSETSEEAFQKELESVLRDNLPPPRKVTLVLKVRVMDGENLAMLTLWAPSEDIIDGLKEGNRVSIHNVQTSGKRSGELQLTAGRQSFVKPEGSATDSFPRRCLTSISEVAVPGFNPPFAEFDTVGMVVSLGPAPHGMKNFEVVNLACPNPDSSASGYLSILFWEGIGVHGFSDILTTGSIVACTNLQWRRGVPRTVPTAYSTEHSTFTRNPRQVYLRSAFELIKNQITDPVSYASRCAAEIATEHQKKSNIFRSPCAGFLQDKLSPRPSPRTPQGLGNVEKNTPAKYSVQRRLEKLQWYGEPPELSPVTLKHGSSKVKQNFIPPTKTPDN